MPGIGLDVEGHAVMSRRGTRRGRQKALNLHAALKRFGTEPASGTDQIRERFPRLHLVRARPNHLADYARPVSARGDKYDVAVVESRVVCGVAAKEIVIQVECPDGFVAALHLDVAQTPVGGGTAGSIQ